MNIISNFVPHKLLKFNCKQPPWMNPNISYSLRKLTKVTKLFCKNPSQSLKELLELLMSKSTECFNSIITENENNQKRMAKMLDSPLTPKNVIVNA